MKKFMTIALTFIMLACILSLSACTSVKFLEEKVVLCKTDLLSDEKEQIKLTCHNFWQKQQGIKEYLLKFTLSGEVSTSTTYSVKFNLNGKDYLESFSLNPISNRLTAYVKIDSFKEKTLSASVIFANNVIEYNLLSEIPENTASLKTVLTNLKDKVPSLISAYTDKNGNFIADIILKISVINQNYYYYVEFNGEDVKTVAFLLNALTGEVLAVKNVK